MVLPTIAELERRDETSLFKEFLDARPRILGAIFDAIAAALRNEGRIDSSTLPRMADFAKFVIGAEESLGWGKGAFLTAYARNRQHANQLALEEDVLGPAIISFIDKIGGSWSGTATELLGQLVELLPDDQTKNHKRWPKHAQMLGKALRRIAPALRGTGIEFSDVRESGGNRTRTILLHRVGN